VLGIPYIKFRDNGSFRIRPVNSEMPFFKKIQNRDRKE
jgi:hypothetical protein